MTRESMLTDLFNSFGRVYHNAAQKPQAQRKIVSLDIDQDQIQINFEDTETVILESLAFLKSYNAMSEAVAPIQLHQVTEEDIKLYLTIEMGYWLA